MNNAELLGGFLSGILAAAVIALFLWIVGVEVDGYYALRIVQWVCLGLAGLFGSYLSIKVMVHRIRKDG